MKTRTISTVDLVGCVQRQLTYRLSLAESTASLLRSNRIDWVCASDSLYSYRKEIEVLCQPIEEALAIAAVEVDLAMIRACREAVCKQIAALEDKLRATCLLNGPSTVSAAS